jgi:hypothetical protein
LKVFIYRSNGFATKAFDRERCSICNTTTTYAPRNERMRRTDNNKPKVIYLDFENALLYHVHDAIEYEHATSSVDCTKQEVRLSSVGVNDIEQKKRNGNKLRIELRLPDSKSSVMTNYTIQSTYYCSFVCVFIFLQTIVPQKLYRALTSDFQGNPPKGVLTITPLHHLVIHSTRRRKKHSHKSSSSNDS